LGQPDNNGDCQGAYPPTDGYNRPFYSLTFGLNIKILADALEGSKLGHKICRRLANKYVLFYIHQGLFSEFAHMQHMYEKCKLRTFFDSSNGLMASHML
jgi:hypothetical protein